MAERFEKICEKGLICLCILITGLFSFWACRYTAYNKEETYWLEKDSVVRNILVLAVFFAVMCLLSRFVLRGNEMQKKRRVMILTVADLVIVGILLFVWVAKANVKPIWDQLQVLHDAIHFLDHEYDDINGYLGMYTQHYSLIFLEGIFLRFWRSYKILQYVNAVCVVLLILFLVLITEECFGSADADLFCLIGVTGMLPIYFYTNYVYGDISSISLIVIAIWGMLRWMKRENWGYLVLCLGCAVVALCARKNILVILIAMAITFLVYGIGRKKYKSFLAAVLVMLLPMTSVELIKLHYEHMSGYEISSGMPALLWIAMGLNQEANGYGLFNGFNEYVYGTYADRDAQKAKEFAWEYIQMRMGEFRQDPGMARYFAQIKLQEQWNEGTFTSIFATSNFEDNIVPEGFVEQVYFGKGSERIVSVMNYYLFLLYLFAFFYWVVSLRKGTGISVCVMGIALVGGFAFSLLWEAKSRYVLGYAILLIPYAAMGIRYAEILLMEKVSVLKKKS